MELMYHPELGMYKTVRVEEVAEHIAAGGVPQLETVYDNGVLVRDMAFAEVRANAKLPAERIRAAEAYVKTLGDLKVEVC